MIKLHHLRDFTMLRAALLVALIGLGHMAHVWQGQPQISASSLDTDQEPRVWRAFFTFECDETKSAEAAPLI